MSAVLSNGFEGSSALPGLLPLFFDRLSSTNVDCPCDCNAGSCCVAYCCSFCCTGNWCSKLCCKSFDWLGPSCGRKGGIPASRSQQWQNCPNHNSWQEVINCPSHNSWQEVTNKRLTKHDRSSHQKESLVSGDKLATFCCFGSATKDKRMDISVTNVTERLR